MNLKTFLAVPLLGLLCSANGWAMTITDFGRLSMDDAATYVTSLVQGASDMLKAHGQPDQADKVIAFFRDTSREGGVQQFAAQLKSLNSQNNKNGTNPNNKIPPYGVEDAMALTLKDHGIDVPASYLKTINRHFMPSPPKLPPATDVSPQSN